MAFVIPTIYKAVDNMTGVQARIGAGMSSLAIHAARVQRSFNALTPSFSATTNNMLELAKGAVTASAAIGAIAFSGKSLLDYETAVQSFRTIVSDLNNTEFDKFKTQIGEVAYATKKSTIDVAQSFEKIAGLNAEFAKTAQGLGMVSTAAITLAKASRMELGPAAESMVGIMNQFSLSVDQADRTINALAAGQAIGAASIQQTADALNNFGATAAGANVSLEQSIALIQTMAKFGQVGENAGHRLRSALIKVQEAGVGYSTGVFKIDEALQALKKQYDNIGTAAAKDTYLTKVFGLEQITAGRILLSNIDTYKQFTQQVTGTAEAYKAAEINSNTLSKRVEELQNKWVTLITTSKGVGSGIKSITSLIGFLTDHMETIVAIGVPIIGFFAAWKGYILAVALASKILVVSQAAVNFILGVATVINGKYATSCFATIAGMNGMVAASYVLEAGFVALAATTGGILLALGAVALAFREGYNESVNYGNAIEEQANKFTKLAKPLTDAEISLRAYNQAMKEYQQIQNYQNFLKQEEKKGFVNYLITKTKETTPFIGNPALYDKAIMERMRPGTFMPKKADFFTNPSDTTQFETPTTDTPQMSYNGQFRMSSDPIEVIVRDGNNNIIGRQSVMPRIESTSKYS